MNPEQTPAADPANPEIVVAITGASGSIYGIKLLSALMSQPITVHLIVSRAGSRVMAHETNFKDSDMGWENIVQVLSDVDNLKFLSYPNSLILSN